VFLAGKLTTLEEHNRSLELSCNGMDECFLQDMFKLILSQFCLQRYKCQFLADGSEISKRLSWPAFSMELLGEKQEMHVILQDCGIHGQDYAYEVLLHEALVKYVMVQTDSSYKEASSKLGFKFVSYHRKKCA